MRWWRIPTASSCGRMPGREKPLLILTSEQVPQEYLTYLDGRNISWLATGKERIDLARATEILATEFGVERMAVVGGSAINTSFLDAGLLDEVSILIGAGIDGRDGMPAVFDSLPMAHPVIPLRLTDVQKIDSGAVWLRYSVSNKNPQILRGNKQ